jgi:glyoxylase-like metal-dependent hydrolase (beta-lactamase superfamily II)
MMKQISEGVWKFYFNNFGSNCYFVKREGKNILIDTSSKENRQDLISGLSKIKIKPENIDAVLLTHLHYDHVGNIDLFKNAKTYASEQEIDNFKRQPFGAVLNEHFIEKIVEGKSVTKPTYEYIKVGNIRIYPIRNLELKFIKIIKVPGHTRGSLAFFMPKEKILFSGDTLFEDGIGRTDLPTSQAEKMENSLKKLRSLHCKILCPGH